MGRRYEHQSTLTTITGKATMGLVFITELSNRGDTMRIGAEAISHA
jgi:hypothetical protein